MLFFFQAEDGIRDYKVTGVQTCALPIWLLFFSSNASAANIVAYSLAAQLTFMLCNALIGLVFLPRASRELTALRAEPASTSATA